MQTNGCVLAPDLTESPQLYKVGFIHSEKTLKNICISGNLLGPEDTGMNKTDNSPYTD